MAEKTKNKFLYSSTLVMNIEECYQVGYISKKHANSGQVVVVLDVDFPQHYKDLESVFIEVSDKQLIPFFILSAEIRNNTAILKLEEVDDAVAATELVGKGVYLPLAALPELDNHQFYYHEVIGFLVVDVVLGNLGIIKSVVALPHQDLLEMEYQGAEVLIPIHDEVFLGLDRTRKEIMVRLPDGLLDIYLDS